MCINDKLSIPSGSLVHNANFPGTGHGEPHEGLNLCLHNSSVKLVENFEKLENREGKIASVMKPIGD